VRRNAALLTPQGDDQCGESFEKRRVSTGGGGSSLGVWHREKRKGKPEILGVTPRVLGRLSDSGSLWLGGAGVSIQTKDSWGVGRQKIWKGSLETPLFGDRQIGGHLKEGLAKDKPYARGGEPPRERQRGGRGKLHLPKP